jgi:hypothetical protein
MIDWSYEFENLYSECHKRTLHVIVTHNKPIRYFSRLHSGNVNKKVGYLGFSSIAIVPRLGELSKVSIHLLKDCEHLLDMIANSKKPGTWDELTSSLI